MEVGQKAPEIHLHDTGLKMVSLKGFSGRKVVLAFYPGAFTSVCQEEMCTLRDNLSKFEKFNAQVIGISVDGPFANKAFSEQNRIKFPILCDFERKAAESYGVLDRDFFNIKGYSVAKRSVFILDGKGIIIYKWVSDDPGIEPNYEEIEKKLAETPRLL